MATATHAVVRERPILFSAEMVRAILDGRKTQTRRVVNLGKSALSPNGPYIDPSADPQSLASTVNRLQKISAEHACKYGRPGDRLWVRESFNIGWLDRGEVLYRANGGSAKECGYSSEPKWSPSIHMPRWASRITLEIVKVRVERVQEIKNSDIQAEGTPNIPTPDDKGMRWQFQQLWDSINAKRGFGWQANPWVWVIEFQRVTNLE